MRSRSLHGFGLLAGAAGLVAAGAACQWVRPRGRAAAEPPSAASRPKEWQLDAVLRYGLPWPAENVEYHPGWVGSMDTARKVPRFCMQYVSRQNIASDTDIKALASRKDEQFFSDTLFPKHLRASPHDYTNSGYDRGHMVPAADAKYLSQQAMEHTFIMANVAPQVGKGFNRTYWARLEQFVRELVTLRCMDAIVVTGPLFLPKKGADGRLTVSYEVIGTSQVAVPTHFFKVIVAERCQGPTSNPSTRAPPVFIAAFILPNEPIAKDTPLEQFLVPLDAVEAAAGLVMFQNLPDARPRVPLCGNQRCTLPPKAGAK